MHLDMGFLQGFTGSYKVIKTISYVIIFKSFSLTLVYLVYLVY
jgi:hypothetical protein